MTRLGMAMAALTIMPALLAAQTDSSRMRNADSTRSHAGRHQTSSGAIDQSKSGTRHLTRDQVTQLQTGLQQANCDPGAIDGVMGQRTRSAMNCARQKNNVAGNNADDLYRSLNLNFADSDTTSRARSGRGPRRMRGDSSAMRMRSDSTRRPSTRKDTSRPGGGTSPH